LCAFLHFRSIRLFPILSEVLKNFLYALAKLARSASSEVSDEAKLTTQANGTQIILI